MQYLVENTSVKNKKKYRLKKEMSQSDLAQVLGVFHQATSKWEIEENYLDFISLIILCQLLD